MIHHLDVEIKGRETLRLMTPDTSDPYPQEPTWPEGTLKATQLMIDQHYTLKLYISSDGVTFVQFREGGGWTQPIRFSDHVRHVFKQEDSR